MQIVDMCVDEVVNAGKKWIKAGEDFSKCPSRFDSSGDIPREDEIVINNYSNL